MTRSTTQQLDSNYGSYNLLENVLLPSIFTFLLFIYLLKRTKSKGSDRINSLPGPGKHFLGSITNIFALKDMTKLLKVFEKWGKEYGPIYQLNFGPFQIINLGSPEYVQKLQGSRNPNHLHKGPFYKIMEPFLKNGLVVSTGDKWKERRRVLNKHMFSFPSLQSHLTIFNEEGDNLVSALGETFPLDGNQEEREIESFLMDAVINIICRAIFGRSAFEFEKIHKAEDEPSLPEVIYGANHIGALRILNPWFLYEPIWRLNPLSKREKLLAKMAYKYVNLVIEDNDKLIDAGKKPHGIIQQLKEEGLPLEGILEESVTLLNTGYETTSSTLHFVLFLLALNPEHQERCREEVDSLFEDANLCPFGDIQYGGLSKLKYLEMCVNETLRIIPTVYMTFRKIEEPLELEDDLILPAGTLISVFNSGIYKNPEIYPEPNKFIPERFSTEEVKNRHPYAHIPFTGGPRLCIGHKFAMMEIVVMLAKILRHYVISTKDRLEDVVFLAFMTLTPQERMKFSLKRRDFSK